MLRRYVAMVIMAGAWLAIHLAAAVSSVHASACSTPIPGDFDCDSDVDLDDLDVMDTCWSGPAIPFSALPGCQAPDADFDLDLDVDMEDFGVFQRCFSGAGDPADPDCMPHSARIVNGCLHVVGTPVSSELALRLQPVIPQILQVDVGNDGSAEFSFNRNQFDCIVVNAGGGEDLVWIDETNGIFTDTEKTTILGGNGDDTLFGGSGGETFIGGDGGDLVFGGSGNDRFVWNPGDDTDLNEGGIGVDTVEVNGADGDEVFTVTANGTRVRFDRRSPAPFSLDIGTTENLVLKANGGNDSASCTGNLASLIQITIDGGPGNDTLLGSNGIDLLIGGDDHDFIDGQQGNDVAFLGSGNDIFQWDPGDGSDTVEGQDGHDLMLFNGSNGSEIFTFSTNGPRLLFARNLGNISMDVNAIEQFDLRTLGSTDTVIVNDLTGTDLTQVNINLAGTIGGTTGDTAADTVIVNGTNGQDIIDVIGTGTSASVAGLSAEINIANTEGANDALVINALGGADAVTATTVPAGVIKLTVDGGADPDVLLGSQGADVFLGGAGDDFIFGDNGDDLALMGADQDTFRWEPGDGNDTIEGQDGADTLLFFGSNSAENIDVVANGGRVLFLRNVANVTMDLNDVENIDFRALGGTDNIVVGDLSGTDVAGISLDLSGSNGGGDTAADTITVTGTNGADVFGAAGDAAGIIVFGLQAAVNIFSPEHANDRLTLNALGGDDVVDGALLEADGIRLTINGGLGDDIAIGGDGDDLITGGDGDDLALMGAGNDTFIWNPGDDNDTLEGQSGSDTLLFNGANVAEQINIFANGARVLFTRDVASVIMDCNDVESIDFAARGGADTITIHDLTGTDAREIDLNLESFPGSGLGDAQADSVIVTGTTGDDVVLAEGGTGGASVVGLAARVNIAGAESANDRVTVNALAGHDVVDASGLAAGAIQLTANGGAGNDILLGGAGNDTLAGGENDDVLLGGLGIDVLSDTLGENILLQSGGTSTTAIVTLFGDGTDNTITVSRDGGGSLFFNGVPIPGATVANTELIRVFGQGGDDVITLDESNGALPAASLYGGTGFDTLTGGAGNDLIFGGIDDDALFGKGGSDFIFGGADSDAMTGGDGGDLVFGEGGNDTDLNEGGSGVDTIEVNGGSGDEEFTVTANGTRVRFDRLAPAPFSLDIGTSENLVLIANGGNDTLACTGNLAALIKITADGGPGDDTLLGSNGIDLLIGGNDHDFIDGQQGNDVVLMGSGNDTFQWDPGDGSDTVEGQDGHDVMLFNGSNGSEIFTFSANGSRLLFNRNLGNIAMDVNGLEQFDLRTLGSTDTVNVHDLAGTDLSQVNINLAGTISGNAGDAAVDSVIVNGTSGGDLVDVAGAGASVSVGGLTAQINIANSEGANDRLTLNLLAGDDVMDASGLAAGVIQLTGDGGPNNDSLTGSAGADVLLGGDGDDVLIGGPGIDVLDGGPGNNTVIQ
ncbi:MAG: hypothetical protein AMXMBFR13_13450 [Phycisphaerae bacterium]